MAGLRPAQVSIFRGHRNLIRKAISTSLMRKTTESGRWILPEILRRWWVRESRAHGRASRAAMAAPPLALKFLCLGQSRLKRTETCWFQMMVTTGFARFQAATSIRLWDQEASAVQVRVKSPYRAATADPPFKPASTTLEER